MDNKEIIEANSFLKDKFNELGIKAYNKGLKDFKFNYRDICDMFVTYNGKEVFDIYMSKYDILYANVMHYDIPNIRQCNQLVQDFVFMTNAQLAHSKIEYN